MRLEPGRLGVWYAIDRIAPQAAREVLRLTEDLGYGALWYPESTGFESFAVAGFALAQTRRLKIGSSIANIYARDAMAARQGMLGLNSYYDNRFILGLGVSHVPLVEKLRGQTFGKPLATMNAYLDAMENRQENAAGWPVMIGALGPKMLALSARRTRGALPYNTTPEHTARARAIMGPDALLAVEQRVLLETDPGRARMLGREALRNYLVLPHYLNAWRGMGFIDADFSHGGSDRLIDAMVAWGDPAEVKDQVRRHFAAGADHVCILPVHAAGDDAARDATITAMADILKRYRLRRCVGEDIWSSVTLAKSRLA